jgi:trehalose 2-sulfotransferase
LFTFPVGYDYITAPMSSSLPRLSYWVCATPRSGSTLLCDVLASTGVAGHPQEFWEALPGTGLPRQPREYLPGLDDAAAGVELPPVEEGPPLPPFPERLAAAVREGTTPNGVFGAKVMWGYLQPVLDGLDGEPEAALPGLHYVLVRRRDKLRQAISLWRAIQTQEWSRHHHEDGEEAPELVYSGAAIDGLRAQLTEQEAAWETWLAERPVRPLVLDYEDYTEDPHVAVTAVLDHLGVPAPQELPARTRMRRQSDHLSEEWRRRHVTEVPS